jgi:hypothetical protein
MGPGIFARFGFYAHGFRSYKRQRAVLKSGKSADDRFFQQKDPEVLIT